MQGKKTQLVKVRSSRNPVLIALITMSLIPLGILGVAMYQSALAAIQAAAFQRVELASGLIANTVSLAYEELAAELQLTASLPRVGRSSAGLIKGFRDFETNPLNEDRVRKELLTYYATTLGVQKDGQQKESPKADAIVERLEGSGLVLHDLYVRSNPNETGKKSWNQINLFFQLMGPSMIAALLVVSVASPLKFP